MDKIFLFLLLYTGMMAQRPIQVAFIGSTGMSYLKSSFEDRLGTGQVLFNYEIYSNPSLVYALGVEAERPFSKTFSLTIGTALNRSGYAYRVFDYQKNSIEHLRYHRFDVVTDFALKGFIFSERAEIPNKKKTKSKKKKATADKTVHPYILAGYYATFLLADRYQFEGKNDDFLIVDHRGLLHGLRLGGGLQKTKWDYSISCRVDMRGVLPSFGTIFLMRQFTFSAAYYLKK